MAMTIHISEPPPSSNRSNPALPHDERDLYTLPRAAQKLSLSRRTLERLIARGAFPSPVKIGRSSRVMREDISNYLEQLRRIRGDKLGTS